LGVIQGAGALLAGAGIELGPLQEALGGADFGRQVGGVDGTQAAEGAQVVEISASSWTWAAM